MFNTLLHLQASNGHWALAWRVDSTLILMLAGAVLLYLLAYRAAALARRPLPAVRQVAAYLAGLSVLTLALLGPFDHFNGVLFSVHMTQHLLLMLVAAPLVVLGRPVQVMLRGLPPRHRRDLLRQTIARRGVRRILSAITHPFSIFALYNGSFVLWHLPRFYQAAVRDEQIHELEHAAFFVTALLFWWVLIDPIPRSHRLSTTSAILLLFATWMVSDLMCAIITLAREPIYPVYVDSAKPWGLTVLTDQRLGGAIMWATSAIYYAAVMIGVLAVPYLRNRPAGSITAQPELPLG